MDTVTIMFVVCKTSGHFARGCRLSVDRFGREVKVGIFVWLVVAGYDPSTPPRTRYLFIPIYLLTRKARFSQCRSQPWLAILSVARGEESCVKRVHAYDASCRMSFIQIHGKTRQVSQCSRLNPAAPFRLRCLREPL